MSSGTAMDVAPGPFVDGTRSSNSQVSPARGIVLLFTFFLSPLQKLSQILGDAFYVFFISLR